MAVYGTFKPQIINNRPEMGRKGHLKSLTSICLFAMLQCSLNAQTLTINRVPADIIQFQGTVSIDYTLQTSTDLSNWQNLALISGNGGGSLSYTNFPSGNKLFYRTVQAAVALISLDAASPLASLVLASDTVNGQSLGLPVLVADVRARDSYPLQLRTIRVAITTTPQGNNATVTAAYLYQGSTLIASSSVTGGTATFANISEGTAGSIIPSGVLIPYTIKVDVTGITTGTVAVNAAIIGVAQEIVSDGNMAWANGNALGAVQTVVGTGPLFQLTSSPSITKIDITPGGATSSVFQYTATFNVTVIAVGEDVSFGLPGSSTPSFGTNSLLASIYQNGSKNDALAAMYSLTAIYSQPPGTILSGDGTRFTLAQNQSVSIPVTYSFIVQNSGANVYAVQLEGVQWSASGTNSVTPFNDQPSWRTPSF